MGHKDLFRHPALTVLHTPVKKMCVSFAEKNGLFLKKSSVRFFQKQAVFFREHDAH